MSLTLIDKQRRDRNRFYKAGGIKLIYQMISDIDATKENPVKLRLLRKKAFEVARQCNIKVKYQQGFVITLLKQAHGKGYIRSLQEPFDTAKMLFPRKKKHIAKSKQITYYITQKGKELKESKENTIIPILKVFNKEEAI
ncbi:hypothetical protein DESAMIL20_296 [Desulfurella amilsii]|uniref:Uncharacterized protein n=1 Tax=Desulfurella amilsii TaxID=1562698 RepID=A0A1X4XZB3_9BACT|nr:hypothetical protein [Desulfurella amilsii]OSS42866.1 hypothetical protein DESAMIL20_296 [Desulfurella amilsii]